MASLQVASLILESQTDQNLKEKLLSTPQWVAQEKKLPWNVVYAAFLTLRQQSLSTKTVWY
jgi:hypothetical protein